MSDTATPDTATQDMLIGIEEITGIAQITLKGDLASDALAAAVDEGVGLPVPGALRLSHDGDARAIWMAPDEVLLIEAAADLPKSMAAIAEQLAGAHHMALDVSDARTVLRLTGPLVGEVLAKGAPCDCSDAGFPPGTARRTHMGGLAVGIWRLDAESWEVVCFRSFGHHLRAWLEQAARPGSEVGWT